MNAARPGPEPAPEIRLLADDLTGALDSAAAFAGSIAVHLDKAPPAQSMAGAEAGVIAVATPTRDVPPDTLPQRLASVLDWLAGGDLAFKKIDSLLRGNTFAECAWLARAGGFDGLVFAPAFPAQGRVTQAGQHYLLAPANTAMAGRTPVGAPLAEAFAPLGLQVHAGEAPAGPMAGDGPQVWVPDILTDADLRALASRTLSGRWLWCGSAGLAHALAAALGRAPARDGSAPAAGSSPAGPARLLMLGASHHAVVRRQWQHLRMAWPAALHVEAGHEQQLAAAHQAMAADFDVAALELSPRDALSPAQAAALLEHQLDELVSRVRRPARLLVVGGDSLLALCRASGAAYLRTRPAARAGWGHAVLAGGAWDGVDCHSRSGAFGGEDDLSAMLRQALAGC